MPGIIIADASCLILLDKIEHLDILRRLFHEVSITPQVAEEFARPLQDWFHVQPCSPQNYEAVLKLNVDKGEASAIALAMDSRDSLLIIDDLKGRKIAEKFGIPITGTLGVLLNAKLSQIIPAINPILQKIKQTNFRISPVLEKSVLAKAGE